MEDGWQPNEKGDYRLNLIEKQTKDKEPMILQLPNIMNEGIEDYENIDRAIEVEISRKPKHNNHDLG